MVDFPTGLPDIPNGVAGNALSVGHTTESHVTSTNRMIANILALATKLGYGSSSPGGSAAILKRLASGTSTWGQLAIDEIPADLISQIGWATGSTNNPTNSSSSLSDLTNMSVTLTTRGGILLAFLSSRFSHSTADNHGGITLDLDGSQLGGSERTAAAGAAGGQYSLATQGRWAPSAASHTVKGRWYSSAGTMTAVGTDRNLIVVELVR